LSINQIEEEEEEEEEEDYKRSITKSITDIGTIPFFKLSFGEN